jgi:hypothetical protein
MVLCPLWIAWLRNSGLAETHICECKVKNTKTLKIVNFNEIDAKDSNP